MNRTLKNVLLAGLILIVPGATIIWLANAVKHNPDEADFKRYIKQNFKRLKTEEQQWLQ